MQALTLERVLCCPHCDAETPESDAYRLSTVDFEWECWRCERWVYRDVSP